MSRRAPEPASNGIGVPRPRPCNLNVSFGVAHVLKDVTSPSPPAPWSDWSVNPDPGNPPSARPSSESTNRPAATCFIGTRTSPECSGKRRQQMRREVQYIPQDPYSSLSPRRTTGQTLAEALDPHGADPKEHRDAIAAALERVKLDPSADGEVPA